MFRAKFAWTAASIPLTLYTCLDIHNVFISNFGPTFVICFNLWWFALLRMHTLFQDIVIIKFMGTMLEKSFGKNLKIYFILLQLPFLISLCDK